VTARFTVLAAVLAGCAFVLALVVTAGAGLGGAGASPGGSGTPIACVERGQITGLTAAVAGNVEVIAAVAEGMASGSPLVARMSLMAAYTESGLVDLGPEAGSDSLGLFQQRASQGWGTPAEEEDPASATAMFVSALLKLPRWESVPPWSAVQEVQRSRFLDGSNYRANWGLAGNILTQVEDMGSGAGLRVADRRDPGRAGCPVRTPGWLHDPGVGRCGRDPSVDLRAGSARQAVSVGRGRAEGVRLLGVDDDGLGVGWCAAAPQHFGSDTRGGGSDRPGGDLAG
jgi:hypothetical protein